MSSKFFTNKDKTDSLEKRLNDILDDEYIEYLEFMIGYFRISGFNKIIDTLSHVKKLKILVGIDIDDSVFEAYDNYKKIKQEFSNEQIEILNSTNLDSTYIDILSQKLLSSQIEMRIFNRNNLHAKMYILRTKAKQKQDSINYMGSVITGSSNLTHNGLSSEGNREINIELNQGEDIVEAVKIFNDIWENESREFTQKDIAHYILPYINKKVQKQYELTLDKIYMKFLISYFGDRIESYSLDMQHTPANFKEFRYQSDAVNDGINKLYQHNGFFLSDVVGLGKTIVATLIVKKLNISTLVISPPAIIPQWKKAFVEFGVENFEIVSIGKIPKSTDKKFIIIDESHKFRNSDTSRYKEVENLCKLPSQKKVMLLSATPQNNHPKDIANQLYLFQERRNSTIGTVPDLESYFKKRSDEFDLLMDKANIDAVSNPSEAIKNDILKHVMIRRTREDIITHKMYKQDIDNFPKLSELIECNYEMDNTLTKKYEKTADLISGTLKYARFKALNQLNDKGKLKYKSLNPTISANVFHDNPLAKLMQILLIKRFESSFYAFKLSLYRHKKRLEKFIKYFEKDIIYLGDRSNEFLDDNDSKFQIVDDKIEYEVKLNFAKSREKRKLKGHIFNKDDFYDDYLELLKEDLKLLELLWSEWVDENKDPKIEKLKTILADHKGKKIVVFTESKDTALYLKDNLKLEKLLCVDGSSRDFLLETIAENFDANYENQKDDYNIIVTTDTLAEGVNLHRSNIIYNYDIPWNATKLMQRIGRINRIGMSETSYDVYNFKPVAKSEELIKLSNNAFNKLQAFHDMLGEDNKIYTNDEQVGSKSLFNVYEEREVLDEELFFLQEIRDFRKHHYTQYLEIKRLPFNLKLSFYDAKRDASTYSYLKYEHTGKFYKVLDKQSFEIDFLEMAKALRGQDLKRMDNTNIDDAISKNMRKYQDALDAMKKTKGDNQASLNDNKAKIKLRNYNKKDILSDAMLDEAIELMEDGVFSTLSSDILRSNDENIEEIIKDKIGNRQKTDQNNLNIDKIKNILSVKFQEV